MIPRRYLKNSDRHYDQTARTTSGHPRLSLSIYRNTIDYTRQRQPDNLFGGSDYSTKTIVTSDWPIRGILRRGFQNHKIYTIDCKYILILNAALAYIQRSLQIASYACRTSLNFSSAAFWTSEPSVATLSGWYLTAILRYAFFTSSLVASEVISRIL